MNIIFFEEYLFCPKTKVFEETSFVTTELAPTKTLSEIVTGPPITLFGPNQILSWKTGYLIFTELF